MKSFQKTIIASLCIASISTLLQPNAATAEDSITIDVSGLEAPYAYYDGKTFIGLVPSLLEDFCAKNHLPCRIVNQVEASNETMVLNFDWVEPGQSKNTVARFFVAHDPVVLVTGASGTDLGKYQDIWSEPEISTKLNNEFVAGALSLDQTVVDRIVDTPNIASKLQRISEGNDLAVLARARTALTILNNSNAVPGTFIIAGSSVGALSEASDSSYLGIAFQGSDKSLESELTTKWQNFLQENEASGRWVDFNTKWAPTMLLSGTCNGNSWLNSVAAVSKQWPKNLPHAVALSEHDEVSVMLNQ